MGKSYRYSNRVTVPLGELYDKVKGEAQAQGKSINDYVKAAIESFANGNVVATDKLFAGPESTDCVFGLECEACPLRKRFPELRKGENLLALKKFCTDCHIKLLHIAKGKEQLKRETKYPKAFEQQKEETYTPPEDMTIKCDTCEAAVSLSDYADFGNPLLAMRNGMLQHVKIHGRTFLQPEEWPAHLSRRLMKTA